MLIVALNKYEEERGGASDESLIVIVSQDGSITSIQQSPQAWTPDGSPLPRSIDELWPLEVTHAVRRSLKRSLRTRQHHCENLENPADGKSYEFLYVPRGRDRVLVVVRNLSNERALLLHLERLAYTDPITQLPNRESLLRQLRTMTELQRLRQGRAAVICLHIGGVGEHEYPMSRVELDTAFRELAERLRMGTRMALGGMRTEALERHTIVARTDFRQFAVVLPVIETGEDAESVVRRLIEVTQRPMEVSGRRVLPSVCAGVALFPQDGVEAAMLLDGAEGAMNEARSEPGRSYRFQSGTVRLRTLHRQDLERELRSALEKEQYALRFLPVVDARDRSPVAMEALLRWPDTAFSKQSTKKLIRLAERTGMMVPIGAWVLQRACEQLQEWRRRGHARIRVAVNLSVQELAGPRVAERVSDILQDVGADPADLDFEINEHVLCRDAAADFAVCRALASTGARIVLDDYGSGVSSIAHLSRSPVSALKLDHRLVANIETNEQDRAVCTASVAMAAKLGMSVTAEGVETERQAQLLRELGCEYLQGFLFVTPMTEREVLDYLGSFRCSSATAGRKAQAVESKAESLQRGSDGIRVG